MSKLVSISLILILMILISTASLPAASPRPNPTGLVISDIAGNEIPSRVKAPLSPVNTWNTMGSVLGNSVMDIELYGADFHAGSNF
jgi:hypothetical protein